MSTDTIPTTACNELAVRRRGLRGTAITGTSPGSGIRGSLAPSVRAGGNSSTAHEGEHPPGACFDRARRARAHQPRSPLPRTRPLTGTCHQRSRSPCQLLTARATKAQMLRSWVCSERWIQRCWRSVCGGGQVVNLRDFAWHFNRFAPPNSAVGAICIV